MSGFGDRRGGGGFRGGRGGSFGDRRGGGGGFGGKIKIKISFCSQLSC